MNTRRAALDGLARIMEATALEDLFAGSDEDALFMYELLLDAARGREARCYWEVCRTARRRGVTPEYVADRASVLLASIEERRRSDVYRLLGVPPLADADTIRHRWLEIAKREHPDVGGDPIRFRQAKDAYELLKDPARRGEYERYWLRALGPIERVAPGPDVVPPPPAPGRRVVMVGRRVGNGGPGEPGDSSAAAGAFADGLAAVRAAVRALPAAELDRTRAEIARRIAALEGIKADLAILARLRAVLVS